MKMFRCGRCYTVYAVNLVDERERDDTVDEESQKLFCRGCGGSLQELTTAVGLVAHPNT